MCPNKQFSLLQPTQHITLLKPKTMAYGGMVGDPNIPVGVLPETDPDRVLTRLMAGELVIPVKHVNHVVKYLKKSGIRLPGM